MELKYAETVYRDETLILTIIPLPFCLMTLVVLCYYIRRRYRLYLEIKLIPFALLRKESYRNHRKNLRIKCIISNFIILILLFELLQNISYVIYLIPDWVLKFDKANVSKFTFLFNVRYYILISVSPIKFSLVPVLSMMMDFLWLAYRKYEYKNNIIRWTVYILIRTFMTFLDHFLLTLCRKYGFTDHCLSFYLISSSLYGFFYIFDFIGFVYFSRKFYFHLKSREREIRLFYFDNNAALESKYLRVHFKIATILVVNSLFFFTFGFSSWEFLEFFATCAGNYPVTARYIPIITKSLVGYVLFPSIIIYKILINLNYLYIFLVIVYKYFKDRQKLANINNYIRPLIEDYHKTLYNNKY